MAQCSFNDGASDQCLGHASVMEPGMIKYGNQGVLCVTTDNTTQTFLNCYGGTAMETRVLHVKGHIFLYAGV